MAPSTRRRVLLFIGIGLAVGLMSGLFGIGGGSIIVPALTLLAGFGHRRAAGTSLAAIVPTAVVGVISYAVHGDVAWIAALILAAAAVVGVQVGTWLLDKLPVVVLRGMFLVFLAVVVVSLFLVIPSRDAQLHLTVVSVIMLVVTGLLTGTFSGLLGVGGGVIIVPALMLGFGASDLIAKGTSLMMMIPTAVSGTVGNLRHGNVDVLAAALIGGSACVTTALGAIIARLIDPFWGNVLFALLVLVIGIRFAMKTVHDGRASRAAGASDAAEA